MQPTQPEPIASPAEAIGALQRGDFARALALAEQACAQAPDDPGWLSLQALALSQLRRASSALPLFQRLVALQPQVAEHWSNLGNCLCELGREAEALAPLQEAARRGARGIDHDYSLARALAANGRPGEALPLLQAAVREAPQDVEIALLRARVLVMLDEYAAAGEALDRLRRAPLAPALRIDAGNLLLQLGLFEDAAACFERARAETVAAAERIDAELGLAAVHERCNRLPQAQDLLQQVEAQRAVCTEGQLEQLDELAAQLASRRGEAAVARAGLQALLDRVGATPASDPMQRGDLWLKLGRACDELGDAPAAMQAFARAHEIRFRHVTATHAAMPRGDGLLAVLDAPLPGRLSVLADAAPGDPPDPVFLVGFPRSGTTLLEQLLDAHPALASFDEQPFLQHLVTRLNAQAPGYPECLAELPEALGRELRARYFSDIARVMPATPDVRAVDKNPLNLVRLPLVASLFPRAQVLLALRHPCDVVLSCYMQNFRSPAFSITFETLASTAHMYARVMAHHHAHADRLNLPIHRIRYEDLVADVEASGRALFGFLGLPWSDDLAAFTERARAKGAISTPSYAQVVQPVNRRAVGRWQRYRPWFEGEVLDILQPWIERFGYGTD